MPDTAAKKNGFASFGESFMRFFREVKSEMKKVIWPTPKDITRNTSIVIGAVIVIGIFVWALGLLFNYLVSFVVK